MTWSATHVLYVDETMVVPGRPGWFQPVFVTEGERGYSPQREDCAPWQFGPGLDAAKEQVDDANAARGIAREQALRIVGRSMWL